MQEIKTYLNNPNLKATNVEIPFEKWQIEEFFKCYKDPIYFIKNYIKIIHVDKGLIPFSLYPYQEEIVNIVLKNRFTILKLPRQSGKTTTVSACILHYLLFNEHKTVAILANKASTAREILNRLQIMYENLPKWMQVGVSTWNKGSFTLGNGCKAIASSTSSSAIRGLSVSWLVLDEFAFVPSNQATEFFESVYPTISSGSETKVSVFSTPKGLNHFYKMWVEATERRSEFYPYEIRWNDVPGRDEKWKQKTIANLGIESWEQEFEANFLGSSNTLLKPSTLRNLVHKTPIDDSSTLKIYEKPKKDHTYFLSVDPSRGTGLDYSVIQVLDITDYPFKQVAVFRDNKINHYMLPTVIKEIAKKYNEAFVLIEINDIGESVANSLSFDEEYENILSTGENKRTIKLGSWKNSKKGLRMTKSVKREGCSILKTLIESNKLIINDWTTIQELSTFEEKNGSYQASDQNNDDTVMALVVFAWATGQDYFEEIIEKNLKKVIIDENIEEIMEELSPIGFFSGIEEEKYWEIVDDRS